MTCTVLESAGDFPAHSCGWGGGVSLPRTPYNMAIFNLLFLPSNLVLSQPPRKGHLGILESDVQEGRARRRLG